jgi:hypothetical protein
VRTSREQSHTERRSEKTLQTASGPASGSCSSLFACTGATALASTFQLLHIDLLGLFEYRRGSLFGIQAELIILHLFLSTASPLDFLYRNQHISESGWTGFAPVHFLKGTTKMDDDECSRSPGEAKSLCFLLGQNSQGEWIVQDESGRYGGIFIDKNDAVRYALFENGRRQEAVIFVPGMMELRWSHSGGNHAALIRGR